MHYAKTANVYLFWDRSKSQAVSSSCAQVLIHCADFATLNQTEPISYFLISKFAAGRAAEQVMSTLRIAGVARQEHLHC